MPLVSQAIYDSMIEGALIGSIAAGASLLNFDKILMTQVQNLGLNGNSARALFLLVLVTGSTVVMSFVNNMRN
jgi:hypothetical protein